MLYFIAPIDIDFAGWSEVEEGKHNAYGVIALATNALHGYAKTVEGAEAIRGRLAISDGKVDQ